MAIIVLQMLECASNTYDCGGVCDGTATTDCIGVCEGWCTACDNNGACAGKFDFFVGHASILVT